MALVFSKYNHTTKLIMGDLDLNTSTLKLALVTNGYVFAATHTLFDNGANNNTDPSFSEVATGAGYTTGGATIASPTLASTGAVCTFDAADVTFTALTKTFLGAVTYASGTFGTLVNPVLFYILFDDTAGGTNRVISGTDFVIRWNANGIIAI